jgi:hypothetical protein
MAAEVMCAVESLHTRKYKQKDQKINEQGRTTAHEARMRPGGRQMI